MRDDDESQLRLETDAAAVQLCTIHKSKGLEYRIVYCPALWHVYLGGEKPFVLARQDASGQLLTPPELDVGSPALDERQEAAQRERKAEDRRLLYVALTRGKHQCRVYWTANKGGAMSALGQLLFPELTDTETDALLEDQLRQWAAERGVERIAVRGPDARRAIRDSGRYRPPRDATVTLHCRPVARASLPPLLQTSFSSLATPRPKPANSRRPIGTSCRRNCPAERGRSPREPSRATAACRWPRCPAAAWWATSLTGCSKSC